METFRAVVLEEAGPTLRELPVSALPEGDVLVSIAYSSLNYKDGLALTGRNRVVRRFPMVPGVDFAGTVEQSRDPRYRPDDRVLLTGWGVGERHWGGFAQKARVSGDWLVPLPSGLSLQEAMAIGSAGFTAMLCVLALEDHGLGRDREVLVTGAAGGVGSVAVAILARLGYPVTAATGRPEEAAFLEALGAQAILDRRELSAPMDKPLASERFGGAVDVVGGDTLAGLLRQMAYGTSVAATGLAGGRELHTTVLPFILRGVSLLGVDSVRTPMPRRKRAWERLATDLPRGMIQAVQQVVGLEAAMALGPEILAGRVKGRVVVDVNA
ncbi:MAG TPA: MDR family oxidoreductase [Stenomitos sp.]